MASASDAQVSEWQASTRMDHQIAAVIARWARDKEKGTALPPNAEFERELDFVPSSSSYTRAKKLLVRVGVLGSGDGPYYVALFSRSMTSEEPADVGKCIMLPLPENPS
jgi:hypothetical protein